MPAPASAAAPAPATPEPAQPTTEATTEVAQPPSGTGDILAEAIDSLPDADASTPESDETAEETPGPKKPVQEPKRKGAWRLNDDLLKEEALATPDGVKAAAAHLSEGKRELHRKWLGMEERERRFDRTKTETLQLQQNLRAQASLLQSSMQALRTGDALTALQALGTLTGRDGVAVLEELNLTVARNGKQQPISPEVQQLREELAQLRREKELERQQSQTAQDRQFVQRRLGEMVTAAQQGAERWPGVAHYANDNPNAVAQALHEIKTGYYAEHSQALDDEAAIDMLEEQINYFRSVPTTQNRAAPQGVGGREPVVSRQAKPETGAQRTPGKSVTPSLASQSVTTREMTEQERLRDLADDPELFRMLGLD